MDKSKRIPSVDLSQEEINDQYKDISSDLKIIWEVELQLLDKIDSICKKYNITYFADGGTLLGAIRHGGFIPWDDDIDIQMFYKDYKKFCKVVRKEIKDPIFWQTWQTEDGFLPWIGKLRSSELIIETDFEKLFGNSWNKGVSLDVFTLYYIPENIIIRNLQLFILKFLRAAYHGYESLNAKSVRANNQRINWVFCTLYRIISPVCDYKAISKIYNRVVLWQKTPSSQVGVLAFEPGKANLVWNTEWFEKTIDVPFMDRMVPVPVEWDLRLERQYGDYMKPVKGKSRHGQMKIKK